MATAGRSGAAPQSLRLEPSCPPGPPPARPGAPPVHSGKALCLWVLWGGGGSRCHPPACAVTHSRAGESAGMGGEHRAGLAVTQGLAQQDRMGTAHCYGNASQTDRCCVAGEGSQAGPGWAGKPGSWERLRPTAWPQPYSRLQSRPQPHSRPQPNSRPQPYSSLHSRPQPYSRPQPSKTAPLHSRPGIHSSTSEPWRPLAPHQPPTPP